MANLGSLFRISNSILCGFRNGYNPSAWISSTKYSQSAEDKLGIERPKRPLTAFLKFAFQVRPTLIAKNPNIKTIDVMKLASKHWQQLSVDAKTKIQQECKKELDDYKKKKEAHDASLTPEQKEEIFKMKEEMAAAKEKRKLKAAKKELGRPKKPPTSYILFGLSVKDKVSGKGFNNYQAAVSEMWNKLSPAEKASWDEKSTALREKYMVELSQWEQKMLRLGNIDVISKKTSEQRRKSTTKSE